jgi:hypothetical protein
MTSAASALLDDAPDDAADISPGHDLVLGAGVAACSLLSYVFLLPLGIEEPAALSAPPLSPSFWPRIILAILFLVGCAIALQGIVRLMRGAALRPAVREPLSGLFLSMLFLLVSYASIELLGMAVACALATLLYTLPFGERRPFIVLTLCALPFVLQIFFTRLAGVQIPTGLFG